MGRLPNRLIKRPYFRSLWSWKCARYGHMAFSIGVSNLAIVKLYFDDATDGELERRN